MTLHTIVLVVQMKTTQQILAMLAMTQISTILKPERMKNSTRILKNNNPDKNT